MDTLLDALRLHLLVSLPQTFIYWLFAFSFLSPQPTGLIKRILLLTILHSLYTDLFILFIPTYLQLLNTLFAFIVLIIILFKELPLRTKAFIFLGGMIFGILMDMIMNSIALLAGVNNLNSLLREDLSTLVSILYPQLTIILLTSWLIRKRMTISAFRALAIHFKEKTSFIKIITLIIIQVIALGALFTVRYAADANEQLILTVLIYFTIVVSLSALVYMFRLMIQSRAEAIRSTQNLYVEDINNMFTSVRGQRHDFLNHVQVIHTMAQMGKYEQLREYTSNLVQETQEVSNIINHTAPALAAFAQAKTTVALGYGIAFTCDLPNQWNVPDSAINMFDIIKILGNLVDNAFDETNLLPAGERSVHVSIQTNIEGIMLKVSNRGRPIDEETRARIFQAGYSTKGEGHSGLGLAIIQERVRHYSGKLDVESDTTSSTTIFSVRLPCELRSLVDQPAS